MAHSDTKKAMNKDRSFLAVVGQLDPEEHPQVTQFVKEAQARVDRKRASDAARRERGRRVVQKWLSEHPCSDCGAADPRILECDHVGVKNFVIGENLWRPVRKLEAELALCESRCRNCHAIRHYEARQQSREFSYEELW
jgi:hypothetical protein